MDRSLSNRMSLDAIMYMIHHLFLPSKLPQENDFDPAHETILLKTIRDALQKFKAIAGPGQQDIINSVVDLMKNLRLVRDESGNISQRKLEDALLNLSAKGGLIPLHIRAQNAGLIISRTSEDVCFEAFELSPLNESIIKTKGRLRRSFPGVSVAVNQSTFDEDGFQATLAQAIAKMSHQTAPDMQPKVKKASEMHSEDRDTANPKLVTEHLMSFLRAAGKPAEVTALWKNTRDEVMWLNCLQPWRRSPMWLLARVAMQLIFSRSAIPTKPSTDLYKVFIVFLLAHVLELSHAHAHHLKNDILLAMNAKLSQRLVKFGVAQANPWFDVVRKVMSATQELIEKRWQDILAQAHPNLNMPRLHSLNFKDDTFIHLPDLNDYIATMAKRERSTGCSTFNPTSILPSYPHDVLPTNLVALTGEYQVFSLAAFEVWVDSHLYSWLDRHIYDETTCERLKNLIESYYSSAASYYTNNPEDSSIMFLTIMELWIACDKSACALSDLLLDFDPEIPVELLQSLILPLSAQMKRLFTVEKYLKGRQDNSKIESPSIFSSFGDPSAFSVRYFNKSSEHQTLLSMIEEQASRKREEKLMELSQKKEEYRNLMELHDRSDCEWYEAIVDKFNDFRETRHSDSCAKCRYACQANSITIGIHEWPLSSRLPDAKSTVFELRVPAAFREWRDATVFLLNDVLGLEYSNDRPRANHALQNDEGLSKFFINNGIFTQRVRLLSEVKPHTATHRRDKTINNTTENDICLKNGLQYQYFDFSKGVFTSAFSATDRVLKLCTYSLPKRASSLQKFLVRPPSMPNGLPPNEVIASQSNCPGHISLDEFKAFGTVPLGCRIQWMNILIQLPAPSLDFTKIEANIMLLQTIYQAGPPSEETVRRFGHEILADEKFGLIFLNELGNALQRVKENWESLWALSSFIHMAVRLLTLATSSMVQGKCLEYLGKARIVAFSWFNILRDKAQLSTDEIHRKEFLSMVVEVALICVNTFDVDQKYLDNVLACSSEASILIQCSITIREYSTSTLGHQSQLHSIMLARWKKLLHRTLNEHTRQVVKLQSACLNDAIKMSWSGYCAGSAWQPIESPYGHWLSSKTEPQHDSEPLLVHFNFLTAELLVNGLPLARLPSNYETHPMYLSLFDHLTQEVMPTRVPGMEFSAKKAYAGFTIHFGMHLAPGRFGPSASDLLLHAVQNDRKYDLLPPRIFCDKFPSTFVDGFIHWYDHTDHSIEFRPLKAPWSTSSANWRLTKVGLLWRLARNGIVLVSVISNTAETLSSILSALEKPLNIHISFNETSGLLDVELPRLQLGFYLESRTSLIYSRQFRGMFVDSDQNIGTLIGLRNKLALKQEKGGDDRIVIIPEGRVTYKKTFNHTVVNVEISTAVKIHTYHIDKRLGRMMDNGNMQSKLFLCYLHSLTSHCMPDPLFQRTGTEQALSILNSAAIRSFSFLTEENVIVLELIAKLTPGRKYYPANEHVMQTVDWDSNISFISQHSSFYMSVKAIFEQSEDGKIFSPESHIQTPCLDFVVENLLERDLNRSSTFRVSDFGADHFIIKHDAEYSPRDRGQNSARAIQSFVTASLIFQRQAVLHAKTHHGLKTSLWNCFVRCGTIQGPEFPLENALLNFDCTWLEDPSRLLGPLWCRIHRSFGSSAYRYNRFHVMMWLSTMAFAKDADLEIVHTLTAFSNIQDLAKIVVPPIPEFKLSRGAGVFLSELKQTIRHARYPFSRCPEANIPKEIGESQNNCKQRRQRQFQSNQDREIDRFAGALESQWPCEVPESPDDETFNTYFNTSQIMNEVRPKFKIWFENHRFHAYLGEIEMVLWRQIVRPIFTPRYVFSIFGSDPQVKKRFVKIDDLFTGSAPSLLAENPSILNALEIIEPAEARASYRLPTLLASLEEKVTGKYEAKYIKDLRDSVDSLQYRVMKKLPNFEGRDKEHLLQGHLADCNQRVQDLYSLMVRFAGWESQIPQTRATTVQQWPRISPILFLEQLTHRRWNKLTYGWKKCIVSYGLALTELQRAERLLRLSDNFLDLQGELLNAGHRNWDPFEFPEILLLEVESEFMIREVQEEIAQKMRNPPSNKNAVMQLNMGEGKSSVIVPIVVVTEADGTRVVMVIVAKPQSKQMFQMLVSKLGGLLGRRIYHMPFSRALRLDVPQADAIGRICRDCMANRGVFLVQPEHILSFKLMGLECLMTGRETVGQSLLKTQFFFDTKSRDFVDESDENYSVKFELIYTMGMQRSIEFSPERWITIQIVLDLVARFASEVKHHLPRSIEVDERWPGRFPRTRILCLDAQDLILERVADHICETGFSGFPVARQPERVRQAVFKYITSSDLTVEEIDQVENDSNGSLWTDLTKNYLLLIRGLIAGGILSFAFGSKRWRVNYGLDPNRSPKTKLAVPFRAKDNPTPRSEFSHPDVVIVLTSLSYYYGGLDDDDLFIAFSHLIKSDQAQMEYGEWVRTAPDLPEAFRQLVGINIKDRFQCIEQVFPSLRYSKGVIDYFLSHIIFPKEMKEFPHKISASGWDIGQIKAHPTTGFSGTNDSRHILPLSVQHLDLPEQKHTNALVLEYLLQDENSVKLLPRADLSTAPDASLLLATVERMNPPVQVILDVGAQIIELSNFQVAEEWLSMRTNHEQAKAIVFFNDSDELSVLDRNGRTELLQTSAFAKQLDVCLVFLDEAHTRGTDLKLPSHYRAAVTLGTNLTKDRLVQACMRLRKLGKGQSVVFCIPEEIKTKILERTSKQCDATIEVAEVLGWAISETCLDLRRSMPLWAAQGRRFEDQKILWDEARRENQFKFSEGQAEKFLEEEAQTLDHRYRPHASSKTPQLSGWDVDNENISCIIERCLEFESLNFASATLQEEQERELSPEIQQERQVERPAPAEPERHRIHDDVRSFVITGDLVTNSESFLPAFETLRSSSAGSHFDVSQFSHDVLVTADFARTVKISGRSYISDAFQRPVQWILTSTGVDHSNAIEHMVIISPFEAQELLALIQSYRKVTLHIYAPRPNLAFSALDALDLFVVGKSFDPNRVPRHLTVQLNLFAGQLYLNSFKEYTDLCDFLGLAWKAAEEGVLVRADGFIVPTPGKSGFKESPVKFLKMLMTKIRRNCEGIEKTHLGKILDGGLLEKADFDT